MSSRAQITRLIAAAGLVGMAPSLAQATILSWAAPVNGAASTSTNWSPNAVPSAADTLNYAVAGSYGVTFNATVPTDASNDFNAGTVSITALSPHTTTGQFVVGHTGTATVNLIGGQFSVGGPLALCSAGNSGTMTVTGPASSLLCTSAASQLRIGNGNSTTTGTMSILNGGLVQCVGGVLLGSFGSSQGTLLVSGLNGATHSRLVTTDASAGDITVGTAGNGSMTVELGGQVTCADQFSVAPTAGFTGGLTVGATGTGSVTVAHDLLIGNNSTAAASGAGTLTIGPAGFVQVSGVTRVGDANGGTGTVDLSTNGQLTTFGLVVDSTNGTLIHTDGTLTIFAAPFVPGTSGYVLNGAGNPTLIMSTGATLTTTSSVQIGQSQSGTLRIISADAVLSTGSGGEIALGTSVTGNGSLTVQNGGSAVTGFNGVVEVGRSGTGTLNVNANGTVQATSVLVAMNAGSTGTANVDGANAFLHALAAVTVGGDGSGPGGAGALTITNGGRVDVGNFMTVWAPGSLTITDSTLNVGGTLTFDQPTMTMTNGTINADLFTVNNTDISASGSINARIFASSSATNFIATGPLTMGDAAASDGFFSFGSLNVGAHPVTLLDANSAGPGNVAINGGSLTAVNGTFLSIGDVLSGTGTVNGPLTNSGSISPTGVNGLTLNGLVSGIGQGITGTKITFGSGGGFTGTGNVNTQVVTLPGSTITATGPLTLGDSGGPTDLCTIGGTILAGGNTVQLLDAVRPTVTGTVELQGGQLSGFPFAAGVLLLRTGAEPAMLSGRGTAVQVIHNNGLVSPGRLAGDRTEAIIFQGGYDQRGVGANAPGRLDIELEGLAANQKDSVFVTGTAFLAGTLVVTRINGFNPTVGQQFTILTATSVSGTFSNVIAPGFTVIYSPTDVQVRFVGICDSADFNCDEDLGTDADIEAFFACLAGNCPGLPCHNDADFNNDGDIGTDGDIEAFFRVLAGGPCFQ